MRSSHNRLTPPERVLQLNEETNDKLDLTKIETNEETKRQVVITETNRQINKQIETERQTDR